MQKARPLFALKPSTLAVALALCGAPLALQAATISLSASYSLDGNTETDGLTDAGAQISGEPPPYPVNNGSDFYLFKQSALSNVFFHTYGFLGSPTSFGARASGQGQWTAATTANYSTVFTNSSLSAVPLSLTFFVDDGELGLFGSGTGMAELILRVRVNGVDVARDQTTIVTDTSGTTCTENDLSGALSSYMSCGSAGAFQTFGTGGLFTVDLGVVGAGETFDIDYDIIATTSGSFSEGAVNCNHEGYGGYEGYGVLALQAQSEEGGYFCPTFNGIARSGDPFNLPVSQVSPGAPFDPRLNVPTPGTLALFGLAGVIGAGVQRRRHRRRC